MCLFTPAWEQGRIVYSDAAPYHSEMIDQHRIAVVIPCYRETDHILDVIAAIGSQVDHIYVIDDCCPDKTGSYVDSHCFDKRVRIIYHDENSGVGAAVKTGYRAGLEDGMDIMVKLDGDGQMNPALIPALVQPLVQGRVDYAKGNRFHELKHLKAMPPARLFGNAVLSFVNKFMSGYWHIMDPTNGFTAIHADIVKKLPLDKIDNGYFFESDMLFRLSTLRAVVWDIVMASKYADESSSMRISEVIISFPAKYLKRFCKRIFYNYFLRDFNVGSLELLFGLMLSLFGLIVGISGWYEAGKAGEYASSGTVMLAALPLLIGFQLLLSFIHFDIDNQPSPRR